MRWQDIVISICQAGFFFAMLPTIMGKRKPAFATSLMNVVLVTPIVICLATLGLWLSFATGLTTAAAWLIVTIQTWPKKAS